MVWAPIFQGTVGRQENARDVTYRNMASLRKRQSINLLPENSISELAVVWKKGYFWFSSRIWIGFFFRVFHGY